MVKEALLTDDVLSSFVSFYDPSTSNKQCKKCRCFFFPGCTLSAGELYTLITTEN